MGGKEVRVSAVYEQDTKKWHRYRIEDNTEVVGTLYISKEGDIPESITIKPCVLENKE